MPAVNNVFISRLEGFVGSDPLEIFAFFTSDVIFCSSEPNGDQGFSKSSFGMGNPILRNETKYPVCILLVAGSTPTALYSRSFRILKTSCAMIFILELKK